MTTTTMRRADMFYNPNNQTEYWLSRPPIGVLETGSIDIQEQDGRRFRIETGYPAGHAFCVAYQIDPTQEYYELTNYERDTVHEHLNLGHARMETPIRVRWNDERYQFKGSFEEWVSCTTVYESSWDGSRPVTNRVLRSLNLPIIPEPERPNLNPTLNNVAELNDALNQIDNATADAISRIASISTQLSVTGNIIATSSSCQPVVQSVAVTQQFFCAFCHAYFYSSPELTAHTALTHPASRYNFTPPLPFGLHIFHCEQCRSEFLALDSFKEHMDIHREREWRFKNNPPVLPGESIPPVQKKRFTRRPDRSNLIADEFIPVDEEDVYK